MNTNNLSFGLIISTFVLLIVAVATSNWGCGNILTHCNSGSQVAAKVLFMLGLVCCAVVLILEIMGVSSLVYRGNATLNMTRLIMLGIAVVSLIICILIMTADYLHLWSYMCAVIAMTLAAQAMIIGLMTSTCVVTTRSSGHVVVRQTVVSH